MPPPPASLNKNPNKKQTGTVPKVTSSTMASVTAKTLSSTNRQNDSINSGKASSSSSSHKNTEIVAPTRRELNDLNDYLLSVAESSSTTSSSQPTTSSVKQQNSGGVSGTVTNSTHLDTTCFDLDNLNFQENQRYCYPVRPIPRQHNNKEILDHHQAHRLATSSVTSSSASNYHLINNTSSTTTTSNLINSAAAIGVVIPTTPNSTTLIEDNNFNNHSNNSRLQNIINSTTNNQAYNLNIGEANAANVINNTINDGDLTWEQRLNFIQYFLSLTSKSINKEKDLNIINANMVNERRDNNLDGELIVNSASLEDVAPNETSNTRAHSVTSIHTVSDPNTPTYEELQTKLETSNRNIQNIKDQQQHLYRLQQAAKQHLVDMENIRNQTRFRPNAMNRRREDGTPDYDSVEQVHDDMTSLVNRMKTLQTLIQGQHELSALLGDDGPEVMAEQEALQRKLDDLKIQRQDMKNLVSELQEISNVAEKTAQAQQQQSQQHNIDEPRNVPIEYQRVVPIELVGAAKGTNTTGQQNKPIHNGHCEHHNGTHNGSLASNSDISDELNVENTLEDENPEMVAETTDLIRQKMADINAMKNQLKRLKDMMETVKIIEEKTAGKSVKDIGNEDISEESINKQKHANRNSGLATLLTAPGTDQQNDCTAEEEEMSEKVRMLHEMTEDLREQARQMSSERERLKAIKDEIKRRREVVEKSSSRENSISRSISHTNSNLNNEAEKHLLEAEYEAKKKEFEKLCQRLQEEDTVEDEKIDDVQEDDETRQTEKQETPPQQYNRDNWRCSNVASIPSINSCKGQSSEAGMTPLRGKDSADSGAADVHGQPSIEAASFKSGSSRSYSVPPPMRAINNREMPWRKNSQDNTSSQFSHFIAPLPPPHPQQPGGVPSNWNPAYYYSTPYAQQCSPHFHSGGTGDCCTHQCHPNSTLNASNQQHVTSSMSNDPVLLQQFIQTQQMLINSVSQCNQLLWHQQKEINNLNNAVLLLQERLLNSNDINLSRAESVPNPVVANTFCLQQSSRAQSEQPHSYPQQQQQQQQQQSIQQQPPMSPIRNYHAQSHNIFHQYRRNITTAGCNHINCCGNSSTNTSYNNFANEQQHVPPTQSTNQNFLNNDIPPNSTGPAGPIFMHHHNNTITPMQAPPPQQQQQQHNPHHLNNSNILNSQQNCLNSPNPNVTAVAAATSSSSGPNNINSVPTNTSNNAAVAAASALNNQVPPGNRANNYWDNFRSYSRQNLLSSNSCKSNEEQNHHYQQMNPSSSSLFGQNLLSSSSSSMTNQNLNGFRNLYQQQGMNNNCGTSTNSNNNVNGIISNLDSITKFRNQFNNINCIEQQQQQQQPHENSLHNIQSQQQQQQQQQQSQEQNLLNTINNGENIPSSSSNMENFEQQTTNTTATMNVIQNSNLQNFNFMDNLNDDIFNNCNYNNSNNTNTNNTNNTNNINSNVAAIFGSPDFRNMNFNFGINEFQKKIPFKTPCNNNNNNNTKRSRNSQTTPLLNDIFFNQRMMNNVGGNIQQQHQQQHQQQQQQNETCTGDDSENITTSSDGIYQANRQQHQISNSTTTAATTTIENNRDNLNPFENESETLRTICNMFDNQNDIPEEIKRNLLKNALKNHDKFTSKFFESLRNNVCCELHSILHQTTETQLNSQCLLEFFKDLYNYNVYKRSCSNGDSNNGSGGGVGGNVSGDGNGCDGGIAGTESNDDENNEFFDDTNRNGHLLQQAQSLSSLQHHHDQQQQQQHQQQISQQQSLSSLRNLNNTNNHHEQQFSKEQINNTDNNNYNNEIMNSLLNSQDLKRLAYKIMLESSPNDCGIISVEPNSDKDRKFTLKYEKISTTSQRSSPKIPNEIFRPDYELVTFIITNIRNNIRQQYIDDVTIKRISQLILSSFENYILQESSIYQNHEQQQQQQQSCSFQIDHNLISTKELYRRMKSFKIRNRDIFLSRLETYLQTLFVIKVTNDDNLLINNVNLVNDKNISITGGGGGGAFGGGGGGCGGVIKKDDTIENRSDLNLSLNYNAENVRKFSQINNNNHNNNTNNTNNTNKSNKSFVREDELTINDINSDNNKTEQIESQNSSTIFFRNSPIYHHLSSDTSLNVVTNGSVPQSQHPQQPQQPPTATIKIEKDQLTPTNLMNNSMNNIMNEDLAEADQICSSSNNVSSNANNDDNDDNNDNNDGNYSINKQQQQQQQNNNNSNFSLSYDLPSTSSSLTTNQNHSKQICRQQLNRYLETVENCLNHRHQHYPQNNIFNNIYNHHENDYNICTEDDIQNLVTNYSNFIRSETTSNNNNNNNSNALLTQLSLSDYNNRAEEEEDEDDEIEQQQQHKQSQQQQHYNNHDNETIENVSEYFKKYYNGTCQNDDGQRISVVIGENCNDDDEDENGGGGIKIKRYNNVYDKEIHVENVKDEIVECSSSSECDNIKMRINENIIINDHDDIIETNIHDNDNAEDDNNDHAQQFMMTDAACALVFPMVPMNASGAGATVGAATVTKTNTENDSIDLLRQSHRYQNSSTIINCSQTDNSSNNTAAGQDYITLGAITFINNDNNGNTSNKRNSSSIP